MATTFTTTNSPSTITGSSLPIVDDDSHLGQANDISRPLRCRDLRFSLMEPSLFDRYLYWLGIDSFPFSARAPVKIMVGPFLFAQYDGRKLAGGGFRLERRNS